MPAKKNFTTANDAVDKLFTVSPAEEQAPVPKQSNKNRKRSERFCLLLDEQLKEDLTLLSKAINSKSVNDLMVTVLSEYIERQDNQTKLNQYRTLLEG